METKRREIYFRRFHHYVVKSQTNYVSGLQISCHDARMLLTSTGMNSWSQVLSTLSCAYRNMHVTQRTYTSPK